MAGCGTASGSPAPFARDAPAQQLDLAGEFAGTVDLRGNRVMIDAPPGTRFERRREVLTVQVPADIPC
jgi:hypothetical protein